MCSSTRLKGKVKATSVPPAAMHSADEKRLRAMSERVRGPLLFGRGIGLLEGGLHSCCVFVLVEEGWRCPTCQSPCWNQRSWGMVMVYSQPTLTTSFAPHIKRLQIWPPEHGHNSHFVGHVSDVTTVWLLLGQNWNAVKCDFGKLLATFEIKFQRLYKP